MSRVELKQRTDERESGRSNEKRHRGDLPLSFVVIVSSNPIIRTGFSAI